MKKIVMVCGLVILLILPFAGLLILSNLEQIEYQPSTELEIQEIAYGQAYPVEKMDLRESITVDGKGISAKYIFQDLKQYADPYKIRFIIDAGDYVINGETIGYYNSQPVLSTVTGIVSFINTGDDSYIRYKSTDEVELEITTDSQKAINILSQNNCSLTDEAGNVYTVIKEVKGKNQDSKTYLLQCNNASALEYDQEYEQLQLFTNQIYTQSLVVNQACVYSYPEKQDEYYVRIVDENNVFVEEKMVEVGYKSGNYISITGVKEGTLCDSGYGNLINGRDNLNDE